ncbi:MAG: penicillin-binding protein 2 [Candidatus Pacebacteria bacterium]|nr:penicillin-binding protein 2 [Candidatus Paceibacterota bacterium]
MRRQSVIRIRFITAGILALSVVLLARLYQIQILHGDSYRAQAESQYVHTVRDLFSRGSIYLRTKDGEQVSAATIQSGYLLAINPSRITDSAATYAALSSIIPLDEETFHIRAARTERTYQEIAQRVSKADADTIDALDLTGVHLYRNQWRYYPGKSLAARTIGFIGYSGDSLTGLYGLERYYDDTLHRGNERLSVNFFAEIFSNLGGVVFDTTEGRAGDVVTSIEPTVARTLDRVLEDMRATYESKLTGGVIINPKTGDIYALGVTPFFDLNNRKGVAIDEFRNPLVENVYELGSIIKPLTVAAGLDVGAITPQSTYYDAGFLEMDEFTISNYDGKGRGYVDMQTVLSQSLNTGVAHIVSEMGKEQFREYFLNLKLGTETGIDLPNETYGLVKNLDSPRDIEYATASFGQGIALTPIAAVRALSTLASGGVLVTPHIVQRVVYENGNSHDIGFPQGAQVFSTETAEDISRMLVRVVDEALLGGTVAMEHYSIAAKTGTAQIADQENGGYYEDKFLHSFFGYFPAYEPEFLIFLYTVEPQGVRYASETLTAPFMELARFLINYYNIPPDR